MQEAREYLIYHSDRENQYVDKEYQNQQRKKGIQTSMNRKGNCYENTCIESSHSNIKKDLIHHQD
ncbi:DDE-type integrase/transposase/recombinase [Staphylococcus delphini]|nr:DDE-type integrase/transposase/recombinase [Staphylococcus delphini]